MATVALIPSFEPNDTLLELIEGLRVRGIERVVVDDGSGERFLPLFKEATRNAVVLTYRVNQGKGHALKLGMRYIEEHYPSDTVVVTVDADGQHTANDTVRCAQQAAQHPHEVVLGCRSFSDAGVPLRSRLGNIFTRGVYRLVSGQTVSDTQTGLRAFSAGLISFLVGISGERYEYEMNVLLACPENHVPIREIPIDTIYENGNSCSHFRPIRDSLRIYAGILGFAASSFASFLVDLMAFGILSGLFLGMGLGGMGVLAANVLARLVSATFNYMVNRTLVFRSAEKVVSTAGRYAVVAAGVLAANTMAMLVLNGLLGIRPLVAKVAIETCLFVASWLVQSRFVFVRKRW